MRKKIILGCCMAILSMNCPKDFYSFQGYTTDNPALFVVIQTMMGVKLIMVKIIYQLRLVTFLLKNKSFDFLQSIV